MRLHLVKAGLFFLLYLSTAGLSRAVTPDAKLVALVPATAQMVAGMNVPPRSGQPSTFLMTTHNGTIDLKDFMSISGVDGSRAFDQIIMVASKRNGDPYGEHSLIADGRFDQALIDRSVRQAGAKAIHYRGIPVLEMQPFARERDSFHEVRWLAMMDSKLAVFGTAALVQEELERYLNHSPADPSLQRRLRRLRHDDVTWCVATLPERDNDIRPILRMLDSRFADLLRIGDTVQFGVRYGRQVEFEYEVSVASRPDAAVIQRSFAEPVTNPVEDSLMPAATLSRVDGGVRGVLKVPKPRYESWLAEAIGSVERAAAGTSPH